MASGVCACEATKTTKDETIQEEVAILVIYGDDLFDYFLIIADYAGSLYN